MCHKGACKLSAPVRVPKQREEITVEWLNAVLNRHQIVVQKFRFVGDSKFGRGCLSDLIRLQLEVLKGDNTASEEMGLVLKSLPSNPDVRGYVLGKGYCQNEVQMYTEVLPAIESFLDSCGVSPSNRFSFPKCYFGQGEEGEKPEDYNFILVLEDLVASKHKFWDEGAKKSFDWEHASAAIKSIALFHAATAAYKVSKGFNLYEEEFPRFIKHTVDDPALDNYIKAGFEVTREVLMEGELPEGLLERVNLLEEKFKPIVQKILIDVDQTCVNVVRHSDLHFFNIAFLHDQNHNGVQAKWFDFQNCCEGRPMADLAFLLMLNCDPDYSTVKLDRCLELYHQTFTAVINETNVGIAYSLDTMRQEFSLCRLPSILHIISGSPMWSVGPHCNSVSRERLRKVITQAYEIGELIIPDL